MFVLSKTMMMENKNDFRNREANRVVAGLILVAVGVVFLLRNMGFALPYWLFSWPVILILVGIYSGFKHNFRNNTWIILIAIGGFFLVDRFTPDLRLAHTFWPLVIIGVGVLFILRPKNNMWLNNKEMWDIDKWKNKKEWANESSASTEPDSSDYLNINSVFSGIKRSMLSKNFQGGNIKAVFGGVDIDLSQADINGEVMIRLDVAFGGIKLVLPPHWMLKNEIEGLFHGVEDKRNFNAAGCINPEKILVLKGSVVFGGVDIRSY